MSCTFTVSYMIQPYESRWGIYINISYSPESKYFCRVLSNSGTGSDGRVSSSPNVLSVAKLLFMLTYEKFKEMNHVMSTCMNYWKYMECLFSSLQ